PALRTVGDQGGATDLMSDTIETAADTAPAADRSRSGASPARRSRGGNPNHTMVTDYRQDLRLFPTAWHRVGLIVLLAVFILTPFQLENAWLKILTMCGCYAIAAIGLNVLTGFTGQVSIGHAFFLAVGAYSAANIGSKWAPT